MAPIRARRLNSLRLPALNRADIKTWRFSADATVIARRGSPIEGAIDAVFARFAIDRADDLSAGKAIALELDARPNGALVVRADGRAIVRLAPSAIALADHEGFPAHAAALRRRLPPHEP